MVFFPHRHLLGIKGITEQDITFLLDKADEAVKISRQREKKTSTLRGLTQINLFFEASLNFPLMLLPKLFPPSTLNNFTLAFFLLLLLAPFPSFIHFPFPLLYSIT